MTRVSVRSLLGIAAGLALVALGAAPAAAGAASAAVTAPPYNCSPNGPAGSDRSCTAIGATPG